MSKTYSGEAVCLTTRGLAPDEPKFHQIGSRKYPVIGYVGTESGAQFPLVDIPFVDIPMMSDEHWNELAKECQKKEVSA